MEARYMVLKPKRIREASFYNRLLPMLLILTMILGVISALAPLNAFAALDISGATVLNVATGRIVFTETDAIQYSGATNTIVFTETLNPEGYKLIGTATYGTAAGTATVLVSPGVELTLYLGGVNITNTSGGSCILTTGADVTIVLLDGTVNNLTAGANGGGLVKNGMDEAGKHYLTIRCEHADEPGHLCQGSPTLPCQTDECGHLNALGNTIHAAAIGSSLNGVTLNQGGFCNLYIEGGIISARAGAHTPGIGTMCGNTYWLNGASSHAADPQFIVHGQICKDIYITGGRVYAYGGDSCAGIGSGWGGPVDGIYISDGAYVRAEGGINSPGIGSGGCGNSSPYPTREGILDVSNIVISGGLTVVEAVGSNSTYKQAQYTTAPTVMPGIGAGIVATGSRVGTVTNVQAQPGPGWYSIVKQGGSLTNAVYVNGTPSLSTVDIEPNMFYTLVRFTKGIEKTASLNNGAEETGTAANPIMVTDGDTIRYTLTVGGGEFAAAGAGYVWRILFRQA